MRKICIFGLLAISLLLSLSACDGASKTPACIVGIWEVADAEAYARTVLPPGSFSPDALTYLRGDPELAYQFDADGTLSVLAVNWDSYFNVTTPYEEALLLQAINGSAVGKYSLDGDIVTIYSLTSSQMKYKATLAEVDMMDTSIPSEFLPLFVPPYNAARFECSGDTLTLSLVNRPESVFTLRRIEQVEE